MALPRDQSRVQSPDSGVGGLGTRDSGLRTKGWGWRLRLVGLVVILLGIFSAVGDRGLLPLYRLSRTRAELQHEIARLRESNAQLVEEVRALREDPVRLEAIARDELGLVRPGESVYEFRPPPPAPAQPPKGP